MDGTILGTSFALGSDRWGVLVVAGCSTAPQVPWMKLTVQNCRFGPFAHPRALSGRTIVSHRTTFIIHYTYPQERIPLHSSAAQLQRRQSTQMEVRAMTASG